jgi:hypothetical protein
MRIISRTRTNAAISRMAAVRDIIISNINADDQEYRFEKDRLVKKVSAITNNVTDLLKFGKFPFKCLSKLECYYIQECIHNYEDIADYYIYHHTPRVDASEVLSLQLSLNFYKLDNMMVLLNGESGHRTLMIWDRCNMEHKRSLEQIERLLFVNDYNTTPWTKPINK